MTQFGNLLNPADLEKAVLATLELWFPTYLREVERQAGWQVDRLTNPVRFTNRNSFDAEAGEPLPKVVCISDGTVGSPIKNGKQYRAVWNIGIGVATAARSEEEANDNSKAYGTAVRALLLQHQNLDDSIAVQEIIWTGEKYDDLPIPSQSNLYRAAGIYFTVDVEDVVSRWTGPDVPDQPSYPADGIVETVIIDVEKEAIT